MHGFREYVTWTTSWGVVHGVMGYIPHGIYRIISAHLCIETSTKTKDKVLITGVFAGAVIGGVLLILILSALIVSILVSRRKDKKPSNAAVTPNKRTPPDVPTRPKKQQPFKLTINEAYLAPADASLDRNNRYFTTTTAATSKDLDQSTISCTPIEGKTHNVLQTSQHPLTDSYDYVIPSRL